mgnify:CR=1 FL=1
MSFIVKHFKNRIKYWEVWNEENFNDPNRGAYVQPSLYAPLLNDTYSAIQQTNLTAKVLFGGLGSAWKDSSQYFASVYGFLGSARPFDIFAAHPYYGKTYNQDPQLYMRQPNEMNPGDRTILDKFVTLMQTNGDGSKKIWTTELGWNSSAGVPPPCYWVVTEEQQALYLKRGFDILYYEVPAVDKLIWYQYRDTGAAPPCQGFAADAGGLPQSGSSFVGSALVPPGTDGDINWWFGLYRANKRDPKFSRCAFAAWPATCPLYDVFLPIIIR